MLTTASATAVVMLPFVIMGAGAGLEIIHPMAVVILGGLVTSTLLSLFILPVLYMSFGAGAQPKPVDGASRSPDVTAEPERTRRFGREPRRRAEAFQPEGGEGASPERRGG